MLLLVVIGLVTFSAVSAQKNYEVLFKNAYKSYPNIPPNSVEALSYVQTRITNVKPALDMDHHHGPERFGLFALVENGENYFKNTLIEVSKKTKTDVQKLKQDEQLQINAVAKLMSEWCAINNVTSLEEMAPFFKSFIEIPSSTTIDAFAKDQFLYDIYLVLKNGATENGVTIQKTFINPDKWFSPAVFKVISAPAVTISDGNISNGKDVYPAVPPAGNKELAAVAATDYPSALWVASPNYSSRNATVITDVTVHTTQGSYAGTISWFQNTASQVSAHYVIRSSDGQVTQMVREVNKAWHVGSANPYTVGIEHEGFVDNASWYTTAMYNSSAAVTINICNRNNINKTTCYNGPSSSGVVVLSSAIKIKGHQHYPSQTHVDPGINWNWPLYYSLINPAPACAATTVLNESYIGTNTVNLNWGAVSGATGYAVEWKTSAATVWTTVNVTNNYTTLNGLAAAAAYNWRIKTVCSGSTSTASATKTFTTQVSCYDAYENNNVYTSPTVYPALNGGFVYAKICGSGDVDFYKITTTATSNINLFVENLPKNYNIETYTGAGAFLKGGYAAGTTNEAVVLNNKAAGTYLFRVYGATTAEHDALSDYRLKVTTSAATAAMLTEEDAGALDMQVMPNPARNFTVLQINATAAEKIIITIRDINGQIKTQQQRFVSVGKQQLQINLQQLNNGIYLVQLSNAKGIMFSKQLFISK